MYSGVAPAFPGRSGTHLARKVFWVLLSVIDKYYIHGASPHFFIFRT